ncbi:MAG: sigma factor-like helix-turn-helix DNA-binding protein [Candidatus Dormibacteraceae bacterium]
MRSGRAYVGPWLPEPLVSDEDPARRITDRAEHAEQLTMAMLVVLEALSPEERCAFILREVFGIGYGEIASTLDRSEAAVRQIVHRAREHVRTRRPRFEADGETQRRVTRAFVAASLSGDTSALLALLAPDAVALSDGGGIVTAAINPIRGAGRVARFMAGIGTRASGERFSSAYVNGVFGAVGERDGRVTTVGVLDIVDGLVAGVYVIVNPDKLRHVRPG